MKQMLILYILSSLCCCIDYIKLDVDQTQDFLANSPPVINLEHISPQPARLIESIRVGPDCKGQDFKIPPIEDNNINDVLYYYWYLDNRLVGPQLSIEASNRDKAIITLSIDQQFLLSHLNGKFPPDFFNHPHILEFYVLNLPYTIPESRYIENTLTNNKRNYDRAYWIIMFNNDTC